MHLSYFSFIDIAFFPATHTCTYLSIYVHIIHSVYFNRINEKKIKATDDGSMAASKRVLRLKSTVFKRVLSAIFKADINVAPQLIVNSLLNDHFFLRKIL